MGESAPLISHKLPAPGSFPRPAPLAAGCDGTGISAGAPAALFPILALDLASRVGFCLSRDIGGTLDLTPFRHDRGGMGWHFGQWLADMIVTHKPKLIALELPPKGLKGDAAMILHGLYWQANVVGYAHEVARTDIDPLSLKRWATGMNASKAGMMEEARRRGYRPVDDNAADAALLLEWARERMRGDG